MPLPATFIHNDIHVLKIRSSNFCCFCLTARTMLMIPLMMCAYSPNIFTEHAIALAHTHRFFLIHTRLSITPPSHTHTGQQLQHGTIQPPNGRSKWRTTSSSKGTSPKPTFPRGRCQLRAISAGFPPPPGDPQGPWGPQGLPHQGGNFFGDQFFRGRGGPPLRRGRGLGMRGRGRGFGFGEEEVITSLHYCILKSYSILMSSHKREGYLI